MGDSDLSGEGLVLGNAYGEKLREQVEQRLAFYETGAAPQKNIDAMREVSAKVEVKKKKTDDGTGGDEDENDSSDDAMDLVGDSKAEKKKKEKKEKVSHKRKRGEDTNDEDTNGEVGSTLTATETDVAAEEPAK